MLALWRCEKKTIGKGDTKVSPVWVLYRDWLYRTKISKKFWRAKLGRGCWRYRRPIGRVPRNGRYGPGIGPGHTGGNLGRENA